MNTNPNTKEVVLAQFQGSINEVQAQLAAPVLDGTSFLLARVHTPEGGSPFQQLYGEWHGYLTAPESSPVGWLGADAVPNHLCGAFQFSREDGERWVADLHNEGTRGACLVHWRTFLTERLLGLERTLAFLKSGGAQ